MVSQRTGILGAAVLLLIGMTATRASGIDTTSVLPTLLWDEGIEAVFVAPPPPVAAWMEGAVEDPDGSLARMAEDYDWRTRTPIFARAVGELQNIVNAARTERALTTSEINLGLIPGILDRREDLRDALLGESTLGFSDPGECWEEMAGRIACEQVWAFGCLKFACKANAANTCTIYIPCRTGDWFGDGQDDGLMDLQDELPPLFP